MNQSENKIKLIDFYLYNFNYKLVTKSIFVNTRGLQTVIGYFIASLAVALREIPSVQ